MAGGVGHASSSSSGGGGVSYSSGPEPMVRVPGAVASGMNYSSAAGRAGVEAGDPWAAGGSSSMPKQQRQHTGEGYPDVIYTDPYALTATSSGGGGGGGDYGGGGGLGSGGVGYGGGSRSEPGVRYDVWTGQKGPSTNSEGVVGYRPNYSRSAGGGVSAAATGGGGGAAMGVGGVVSGAPVLDGSSQKNRSSSTSPQRYGADDYGGYDRSASPYEDAYDGGDGAVAGGGTGGAGKKGGDSSRWWEEEDYLDYEPGGHKGGRR